LAISASPWAAANMPDMSSLVTGVVLRSLQRRAMVGSASGTPAVRAKG